VAVPDETLMSMMEIASVRRVSNAIEKCASLRSRKVHHRLEVMAAGQAESRSDGA